DRAYSARADSDGSVSSSLGVRGHFSRTGRIIPDGQQTSTIGRADFPTPYQLLQCVQDGACCSIVELPVAPLRVRHFSGEGITRGVGSQQGAQFLHRERWLLLEQQRQDAGSIRRGGTRPVEDLV